MNYRTRIFERYASCVQNSPLIFDEIEAAQYSKAYEIYLRGWLPLHKEASILEIGCGGGKLLYFLKKKGYSNLHGVDISPEQVNLSKQVIENVTEGNAVEFLLMHINSFDLIVGVDIIEHLKKDEVFDFLDACYNALKTGGRFILQTPNAESPMGLMHRYHDFTHEVAFDSHSLGKLLSLCGFSEIIPRETGPVIHGTKSFFRYLIWKVFRTFLILWNLAETGSKGSGIYTRVFLISAIKE